MRFSNFHTLFGFAFPTTAPSTKADRILIDILHRYTEAARYHHTLWHIDYMAEHYLAVRQQPQEDEALAILFHDAVCNGRHDEEASAFLLAQKAIEFGFIHKDKVESGLSLVLTTKHNGKRPTSLVSDLDLLILADCFFNYKRYAVNIRLEWLQYNDEDYARGRMAFLESMLQRGNIFGGHLAALSPDHAYDDDKAIANMMLEYDFLKSGRPIVCWK